MDLLVDRYIESLPHNKAVIAERIRQIVLNSIPGIKEVLKYKCPFYLYKGLLCYIHTKKDSVYLGFTDGYKLIDEESLLTGNDLKQIRHLEFKSFGDINAEAIHYYLNQAVLLKENK